MKHIILVGEWNSSNLGDNILCRTAESLITAVSEKPCIVHRLDLTRGKMNISKGVSFIYFIVNKLPLRISEKKKIYKRIMVWSVENSLKQLLSIYPISKVIFAGGQLFSSYFLSQICVVVKICNKRNIPVYFNSCGFDNLNESSKDILKEVMQYPCIKGCTLRDGVEDFSAQFSQKAELVPDVAILSNLIFGKGIRTINNNIVGIAPISYDEFKFKNQVSLDCYISFWRQILQELDRLQYKWFFFTNGAQKDKIFIDLLISKLGLDPNISVYAPTKAEDLFDIIENFSLIISCRLHSQILAYSLNIPAISIEWDKKVRSFAEIIDNSENCYFVSKDNIEKIIKSFEQINFTSFYNNKKREFLRQKVLSVLAFYINS